MPAFLNHRRPAPYLTALVGAVLGAALVAGCTSGSTGKDTTGAHGGPTAVTHETNAASGSTSPSGDRTRASHANGSAGASGSTAPAQSSAPDGDGQWHPTIRPAADVPVVPSLVAGLLTGLTLRSVSASSLSVMSNYPYTITVGGTCTAARRTIAHRATASGMTVRAQGSMTAPSLIGGTLGAQWLLIANGQSDGVDLSLVGGPTEKSCAISGVGLTPVVLRRTGHPAGNVVAFAPVTCAAPVKGTVVVGIWAMPLDATGKNTLSLMVSGTGSDGPGKYSAGGSADSTATSSSSGAGSSGSSGSSGDQGDGGGFYSSTPLYNYTQISLQSMADLQKNADDESDDGDDATEGLPAGAHALTGTVTMSRGMASGRLDLAGGGEHITGTFDCGTPSTE